MRTQIRIVSGSLRGRKLSCEVNPSLRPTPLRVREALFSILGNAVPGRPFYDVFAGTGVIGLEALSRGASRAVFIERDFRLIADLEKHFKAFRVQNLADIARTDVYRWADHWRAPAEPATVFLSPPFSDLEERPEDMLRAIASLQEKAAVGSVLVLQAEAAPLLAELPDRPAWDERVYGRNHLLFWVKEDSAASGEPATEEPL